MQTKLLICYKNLMKFIITYIQVPEIIVLQVMFLWSALIEKPMVLKITDNDNVFNILPDLPNKS